MPIVYRLNIDFEGPGYNSEENDKPDTINRLIFPEMKTVLQQVSDGKISGEGAEAAVLMPRIAGDKLPLVFTAFHSFLILNTRP